MNSLYQAILNRIRKVIAPRIPGTSPTLGLPKSPATGPQPAPGSKVIPFAPGRIYRCIYTNYHHDPKPLLFVLSSDAFYTHGINIHYLGSLQTTMLRIIMMMRASNKPLTGLLVYQFLKLRAPGIPKLAYRKYFTKYLRGKLVSDGISQIPTPGKAEWLAEPFVRRLNDLIRPKVINKVFMSQQESDRLKQDMENVKTISDQIILARRARRNV